MSSKKKAKKEQAVSSSDIYPHALIDLMREISDIVNTPSYEPLDIASAMEEAEDPKRKAKLLALWAASQTVRGVVVLPLPYDPACDVEDVSIEEGEPPQEDAPNSRRYLITVKQKCGEEERTAVTEWSLYFLNIDRPKPSPEEEGEEGRYLAVLAVRSTPVFELKEE